MSDLKGAYEEFHAALAREPWARGALGDIKPVAAPLEKLLNAVSDVVRAPAKPPEVDDAAVVLSQLRAQLVAHDRDYPSIWSFGKPDGRSFVLGTGVGDFVVSVQRKRIPATTCAYRDGHGVYCPRDAAANEYGWCLEHWKAAER